MPLSSFLLGRTRPLCRFQPIPLSQPISPKLNYRRLHVIQTAPHTHKLPPLLIPNHVNGKNSHDKKFHWITSIVGATVVVGFAVTREENKASCQSEEPNPTVELVIRDVSRDSVNIWRELLIPDWPLILFSVLAAFASSVIGLLLPTIFGEIVDKAKEGTVVSALKIPALKAIGVLLLQGIVQFGYGSLINLAAERMVNRLKNVLFSHILSQDIRFFDKYQTGDLSSILTSDIEVIRVAFKHSISMGVRSTVSFVGGAASLFMISKELSLLMLLVVPGVVAVGTVYVRFLKRLSRQVQKSIAHTNAVAAEVISNIRTVRAFTNENLERKRYAEKSGESLSLAQKMGVQIATLQGLSTVALNGIGLIVYWYGGYQVSLGHMTAGSLTSFMMHTLALQNSLQQLSILTSQALSASGAIARFEEMARITPKIGAGAGTHLLKLPNVKGVIELRNVTFSYPSRENQQVLTNFTLSLPAGKVTALAGPSGGGKTTVTSLVERFYDPQAGEVTLDEVPLQVLDPTWLRSLIGVVNQEPVLFATTIKENIAYGKPGASDEEVIAAAQRANAHGFVTSFPDGYNTMVGERGIQLSGGQKQRIAIARAVLKNPLILILDEATSALDAESEAQVQQALQDLMKGRTVLVIAHRLSTVQNADNIAVVCDGQIVETGTHTELMRKAGVYAQLVARQMH